MQISIHSHNAYTSTFAQPVADTPVGEESADEARSVFKPVTASGAVAHQEVPRQKMESADDGVTENSAQGSSENAGDERQQLQQQRLERLEIQQLASRDREVRAHEQAHAAVGGQYAGAPSYHYERGPDGVNYAVGGEVAIDMSAVSGDPQATLIKAQAIRQAALAPAEPSPQDRRIAAEAVQMEVRARAELAELKREEAVNNETDIEPSEDEEESQFVSVEDDTEDKAEDRVQQASLVEQSKVFHRLSDELNRRIVSSSIDAQAPLPGEVVSQFA